MNVSWAATSPATGRFGSSEVTTDVADLAERLEELRLQGSGYLEVRLDSDFPVLTLGFSGNVAVVHLFRDGETACLLGDGQGSTGTAVAVPVMEDQAEFTAEFVHDLDAAWALVQQFARTGDVATLGRWTEL